MKQKEPAPLFHHDELKNQNGLKEIDIIIYAQNRVLHGGDFYGIFHQNDGNGEKSGGELRQTAFVFSV